MIAAADEVGTSLDWLIAGRALEQSDMLLPMVREEPAQYIAVRQDFGAILDRLRVIRAEIDVFLEHYDPPSDVAEFARHGASSEFADANALAHTAIAPAPLNLPRSRSVPVFGVEVAAGGGALANEPPESVEGYLAFERGWLDRRGLDATQCVVVSVRGSSMEPTLAAGALILVNRQQRQHRDGRVYVMRSDPDDMLLVKRAAYVAGAWMLVSDNPDPEWQPISWPDARMEVLGEVVWASGAPGAD